MFLLIIWYVIIFLIYMNDKLNDTTLPIQERCLLILKHLHSIRDNDEENRTHNYNDIIHSHNKVLELILASTEE